MTLLEIQRILAARCYTEHNLTAKCPVSACGADLLSDVLAYTKENCLLLTGLIHPQVIRTAEMLDLAAVIFVRGKEPTQEMIEMASSRDIPVLSTPLTMFEACGMLYQAGLGKPKAD